MKKTFFSFAFLLFLINSFAQTTNEKIQTAFRQFEIDSQLKHAVVSLYVIDAATGEVFFDRNSQTGMAPASTQKIITSVTAFELLGKDYRYKTELAYSGKIDKKVLYGDLYVIGSGDPTLGSWRWNSTKNTFVMTKWVEAIKKLGINRINGYLLTNMSKFSIQTIPDGWIWQDIGNYYGAGSASLNWKENQYEMKLSSGKTIGDPVVILNDTVISRDFDNGLRSAAKGTGDNAYIYWDGLVSGTIPINEKSFSISGAAIDPTQELINDFSWFLQANSISNDARCIARPYKSFSRDSVELKKITRFYTYQSPSLDSIIYWFNKRSINLYGEALLKTFAYEKTGFGSTDTGVAIVKKFWKEKGLDEDELNLYDGSGLSPLNRVTTHAQVEILKYAKTRDWFPLFFDALPEFNAMKMKSGTISDVKGFCGYHTARDGKQYIFSFLVNNYTGRSSELVNKMYKVLDVLK